MTPVCIQYRIQALQYTSKVYNSSSSIQAKYTTPVYKHNSIISTVYNSSTAHPQIEILPNLIGKLHKAISLRRRDGFHPDVLEHHLLTILCRIKLCMDTILKGKNLSIPPILHVFEM